jgi:hypothetical protein
MGQWLTDTLTTVTNKGGAQATSTEDVNAETAVKGQRVITLAQPQKVVTEAAATTSQTVTEDAGGSITFRIPIKGGLGATGVPELCPVP